MEGHNNKMDTIHPKANKLLKQNQEENDTPLKKSNYNKDYFTGEHILVCLSPSSSNIKVIQSASQMAIGFNAEFTAVYVENPGRDKLSEKDAHLLRMNQRFAEQLGANIITLYGGNIVNQIVEYAKISGVTKIILGNSFTKKKLFNKNENYIDEFTEWMPNLEIYLIPDYNVDSYKKLAVQREKKGWSIKDKTTFLWDLCLMIGILCFCTMLAYIFKYVGVDEANIVTVYILGVLLTAMATKNQIFNILVSSLSVLCFNIFFTKPYNSLAVYNHGYLITFLIMFLTGYIIASLTKKAKNYGEQAAKKAWRTQILLETSQRLQIVSGTEKIVKVVGEQLLRLTKRDVIYYVGNPEDNKTYSFLIESYSKIDKLKEKEDKKAASCCYLNSKPAGSSTSTFSTAYGLYLAVRSPNGVHGVFGIYLNHEYLSALDEGILNTILYEMAMILEKEKNLEEKTQVQMEIKQEKLRSNLLRSISHDLRTPLTSISGNASVLMQEEHKLTIEKRKALYKDIYEDSVWLYNLVENLLSVTKIENGSTGIQLQPELLEDVMEEAILHMRNKLKNHTIKLQLDEEFIMAWMDANMIIQVVMNLIDNAVKYTPKGSHILIHVYKMKSRAYITISDNGNGISDEEKIKIFDLFYTGGGKCFDKSRSMGIGLSLCYSIIEAHGGKLIVCDNIPKGAKFQFDLKAENIEPLNQ